MLSLLRWFIRLFRGPEHQLADIDAVLAALPRNGRRWEIINRLSREAEGWGTPLTVGTVEWMLTIPITRYDLGYRDWGEGSYDPAPMKVRKRRRRKKRAPKY